MPPSSRRRSATIQLRVIHALIMREVLTRYGRHNIGFLWLFIEPMLFTLGVTTLWTLSKASHGSSLPIVAFAVTGYSSVLLWRNTSGRSLRVCGQIGTTTMTSRSGCTIGPPQDSA